MRLRPRARGRASAENASAAGARDEDAPAEVLAAYPDYSDKMARTAEPIRFLERLNGGLGSVTDACVDAACNRVPLSCYTVGWDALLIRHVLRHVPASVVDAVQTLADR